MPEGSAKIRSHFSDQLKELGQEVLNLGTMVEKAIDQAIEALKQQDLEQARKTIEDDQLINKKRYEIEERCIQLIATQQPVAGDLRFLIAILNIITDLERMGDHAEGIAKICLMIGKQPLIKPLIDIPRMAEKAKEMLRRSLLCLLNKDIRDVFRLCAEDDEVDGLYQQVYHELLLLMIKDPRNIDQGTYLIWVAHNLERIADRATNIAERVYFLVTGKLEERLAVSRY